MFISKSQSNEQVCVNMKGKFPVISYFMSAQTSQILSVMIYK